MPVCTFSSDGLNQASPLVCGKGQSWDYRVRLDHTYLLEDMMQQGIVGVVIHHRRERRSENDGVCGVAREVVQDSPAGCTLSTGQYIYFGDGGSNQHRRTQHAQGRSPQRHHPAYLVEAAHHRRLVGTRMARYRPRSGRAGVDRLSYFGGARGSPSAWWM